MKFDTVFTKTYFIPGESCSAERIWRQLSVTLTQGRSAEAGATEERARLRDPKMAQAHDEAADELSDMKRKAYQQSTTAKKASMAYEVGREGKFVAKGASSGKAIAVFTSGGDAQGRTPSFGVFFLDNRRVISARSFLFFKCDF